eukprot:695881_1
MMYQKRCIPHDDVATSNAKSNHSNAFTSKITFTRKCLVRYSALISKQGCGSLNKTLLLVLFLVISGTVFFLLQQISATSGEQSQNKPTHPILFIHLHKTGGCFIVSMFNQTKHFQLYYPNHWGNPLNAEHNDIPIGHFKDNKSRNNFLSDIEKQNATFIAMESHFFDSNLNFEIMSKEFDLFTMFRDPYKRIISNYFYDVQKNYIDIDKLNTFNTLDEKLKWFCQQKQSIWYHDNYYVRFLNDIQDPSQPINHAHFDEAKRRLSKFTRIGILEFKSTWKRIEDRYNVQLRGGEKVNPHNTSHPNPTSEFEHWFRKRNEWDFKLYEYAVEVAITNCR